MSKRITIIEEIDQISPHELDGKTFEQLCEYMKSQKAHYGDDAYIDWDAWFSFPYDSERSPRYIVKRKRLENDEEYNKRIEKEKKDADAKKAKDLAELERLKKLYEE